jgi:glycerol-3-phosphate dehydrogenase
MSSRSDRPDQDSHLPGGEFRDGIEALVARRARRGRFGEAHTRRLVRAYGTRVERVLGPARSLQDLGPFLGADLTGAEVRYLMEREWAQTEEDVLWRRTKLGLRFSPEERERLATFMAGGRRRFDRSTPRWKVLLRLALISRCCASRVPNCRSGRPAGYGRRFRGQMPVNG